MSDAYDSVNKIDKQSLFCVWFFLFFLSSAVVVKMEKKKKKKVKMKSIHKPLGVVVVA